MELKFTINADNLNDPIDMDGTVEDIKLLIRFLQRANPNYYLVGNMLDEQLQEQLEKMKPAEPEKPEYPKCLANSLDKELDTDSILELLNVAPVNDFSIKIVRDFGYNRTDAHVPCIKESYDHTDDLLEYLDNLIQSEDCKNGCQVYEEEDGTRYLQITGQNFYAKDNKYAGTDTVKVWVKEFVW